VLGELLADEGYREELAKASYYREATEQAAADAEHDDGDSEYMTLSWDCLSDHAKRPYRTTAAHVCIEIATVHASLAA
jgi:hypothetical protein